MGKGNQRAEQAMLNIPREMQRKSTGQGFLQPHLEFVSLSPYSIYDPEFMQDTYGSKAAL